MLNSVIILFAIYMVLTSFLDRDIVIKGILSGVLLLIIVLIFQLQTDGIHINNNIPTVIPTVVNTEDEGAKEDDEESEAIIKAHDELYDKHR